jgi:hypothetical protein
MRAASRAVDQYAEAGHLMLPPELKARVLDATRTVPSPTRRSARINAWLVLPSSVLVAAALYFAKDGVQHGRRPAVFYLACVASWAAIAALSLWAALARGRSPVGRSRAWLVAVAAGTPALLYALSFLVVLVWPELGARPDAPPGFRCFGLTLAAAAFPLVALAYVRRQSDPVHPVASGAALGAACGASAGIMVEMWCPFATIPHMTLGHIVPIVLCTLAGAGLGSRVIAMRPSR